MKLVNACIIFVSAGAATRTIVAPLTLTVKQKKHHRKVQKIKAKVDTGDHEKHIPTTHNDPKNTKGRGQEGGTGPGYGHPRGWCPNRAGSRRGRRKLDSTAAGRNIGHIPSPPGMLELADGLSRWLRLVQPYGPCCVSSLSVLRVAGIIKRVPRRLRNALLRRFRRYSRRKIGGGGRTALACLPFRCRGGMPLPPPMRVMERTAKVDSTCKKYLRVQLPRITR